MAWKRGQVRLDEPEPVPPVMVPPPCPAEPPEVRVLPEDVPEVAPDAPAADDPEEPPDEVPVVEP